MLNRGLNTGGMGLVFSGAALRPRIRKRDARGCRPTLAAMAARGAPLRGVLFVGLMVEGDRLSVLEYNCVLAIPNANR